MIGNGHANVFARHFCHPLHENGHPLHRQGKVFTKNTAWYYRIIGRKQMCNAYNKAADKPAGGGKHEKCKS